MTRPSSVSRHEPAPDHCRVCGNDVAGDPTRCQVCGTTDPATVSSRVWRDRADQDAPRFGSGGFGGDLRRLLGDVR